MRGKIMNFYIVGKMAPSKRFKRVSVNNDGSVTLEDKVIYASFWPDRESAQKLLDELVEHVPGFSGEVRPA